MERQGDPDTDWNGSERRQIPFHLVNFMDEKLRQHEARILLVVDNHMSDEKLRYNKILDTIEHNRVASESRHSALESHISERHELLVKSIESYSEKVEQFRTTVESAFPKDIMGKADFAGHASYHISLIDEAKEAREFRKYIKRVVAAAAAVGILTWLWQVIWPALLAGPTP